MARYTGLTCHPMPAGRGNSGPGIPDSVVEQIFAPLFTTRQEVSGIGLSLTRQIMSARDGNIAFASDETGTRVTLMFQRRLPCTAWVHRLRPSLTRNASARSVPPSARADAGTCYS
jgi:hypothetical protein